MGRKAFSGDFVRELPKGKTEPYRLWFEYLKLAVQDPRNKVNQSFYEAWGDVRAADFDVWWATHWRDLFTVPASVMVVPPQTQPYVDEAEPNKLLVQIDLRCGKKRLLGDLKKLIDVQLKGKRSRVKEQAPFTISSNRSINYNSLRAMLKFLQLHGVHRDLEDTTVAYCAWANDWNNKVRAKKWDRPLVFVPATLTGFMTEITSHQADQAKSRKRVKQSVQYNNAKGDARRFLRKAEKVVANVSVGIFPGTF